MWYILIALFALIPSLPFNQSVAPQALCNYTFVIGSLTSTWIVGVSEDLNV